MENQNTGVELLHDVFETIIVDSETFAVDFDEAWQWIGYASKQKGQEMLEKNFIEGEEFSTVGLKTSTEKGGRPATHIMLTVDCFKAFCMLAQTERGKEVRRYYIRLEKEVRTLGAAFTQHLDPATERRQLIIAIREDKTAAQQLLMELQEIEQYKEYTAITDRIALSERRLKSLDKSTVNQLNLLAERSAN